MNEAEKLSHPLVDVIPTVFYVSMINWIKEASPSLATLNILLSLYLENIPYADLMVQYMLLTPYPERLSQQNKLKQLVKRLRRDGKFLTPEEIACGDYSWDTIGTIRGVGYRLLKGTESQKVQMCFLKEIRILLPDVFLRPLGWQNFSPFVPSIIIEIAEANSGSDENRFSDDFEEIAKFLYGNVKKPYLVELFLVAASLMNEGGKEEERNSPVSIFTIVSVLKRLFDFFFDDLGIKSVADLDPDAHIIKYLYTDLSKHSKATKLQTYRHYIEGRNAVERWRKAHPKTRSELGSWCFPALKVPIDTTALALQSVQERRARRYGQLAGLMPVYLSLLGVVHHRACVFAEISAAFDRAWSEVQERGTGVSAYPFVVSLQDQSATLQFAILAQSGIDRTAAVCEYLGAIDPSGQQLPLPFFALMQRAWYDEAYRAELQQYGIPSYDCKAKAPGLLRPASIASAICRNEYGMAKMENRTAKIYLSIDALCAAAAFGSLAVMIDCSSSMRIHEILQIRIESGYIDDNEGYTDCLIYPKGHKRSKLQGKIIHLEPFVTHFLHSAIKMKRKCNGVFQAIHMERGKSFGFSPGPYLFQWSNSPITRERLTSLMHFITFGVTYQSPVNKFKNLSFHSMRHAQLRGQHALGRNIREIQYDANHKYKRLTLYYLGVSEGRNTKAEFKELSPITMWESMMPDAIK